MVSSSSWLISTSTSTAVAFGFHYIFKPLLLMLVVSCLALFLLALAFRLQNSFRRRRQRRGRRSVTIAFFHPFCSFGGGGERVLWKMIQALGDLYDEGIQLNVVVYTIDAFRDDYQQAVTEHVKERFSTTFSSQLPLTFIHLDSHAFLLQPSPRFSLLVESWRTMKLAYTALTISSRRGLLPDVFVDTMGCAFTYVVANLGFGCRVLAYVHYPTISTDMLRLVWQRRPPDSVFTTANNNNESQLSRTTMYTKLVYYLWFAVGYGIAGSLASLVMVNSTWTYEHISSLWWWAKWRHTIRLVFPPCPVATATVPLEQAQSVRQAAVILSIGQFRPEKDHALQLEALAWLLQEHPELRRRPAQETTTSGTTNSSGGVQLVLLGSCRNNADQKRLQTLILRAARLELSESVRFVVNEPYSVIQDWLAKASVGLHTMWNEHFGISIVEMMAAGLIVVAHDSGGPKSDIVVPPCRHEDDHGVGFLATTKQEYAQALYRAITMDSLRADQVRRRAQQSAQRFTDDIFDKSFKQILLEGKFFRRTE